MKKVHISRVRVGDAVLCTDGKVRTVCHNSFSNGFMGTTLFGDSYRLGTLPVYVLELKDLQKRYK